MNRGLLLSRNEGRTTCSTMIATSKTMAAISAAPEARLRSTPILPGNYVSSAQAKPNAHKGRCAVCANNAFTVGNTSSSNDATFPMRFPPDNLCKCCAKCVVIQSNYSRPKGREREWQVIDAWLLIPICGKPEWFGGYSFCTGWGHARHVVTEMGPNFGYARV